MAMNYVTFNQDYSRLGVGKSIAPCDQRIQNLPDYSRNIWRFSPLQHGSLLKILRNKGGRHRNPRDAFLLPLGLPHPLAPPITAYEHQGQSGTPVAYL